LSSVVTGGGWLVDDFPNLIHWVALPSATFQMEANQVLEQNKTTLGCFLFNAEDFGI